MNVKQLNINKIRQQNQNIIIECMQNDRTVGEKMNGGDKLMKQQWKSEEDYKRMIIALQIQNQKYRNELYQLGETVNKILDKTKPPQSNKGKTPNMQQQLQLVKKELHNVNQFIQIYQKELNSLSSKKKQDQIDNIYSTEELLKVKNEELTQLKREVKQIMHKNKALQYKLHQFSRRNRAKSFDQQILQLKELINENKNLKIKLEDLQHMQEKRQVWLKNNIQTVKTLQQKIQTQQAKLPKIDLKKPESRSQSSLPKLQCEKKIYTKWLQSNRDKSNTKLEKQLQDLQTINKMVHDKIKNTSNQIRQIEEQIAKIKSRVTQSEAQLVNEPVEDKTIRKKDVGCMVAKRMRKCRRDWVGKFDSLRFSDARLVRQESRIYKILFNSMGYFQFSYYTVKDSKKKYVGKLPFDHNFLHGLGKQYTFTVQHPDFIKNVRLKINLKSHKIVQMHLVSNLGIQGEFIVDASIQVNANKKADKKESKTNINSQDDGEVNYEMDVKANEAITSIFGSYGFRTDDKKVIIGVWLEGIGVELIEDFVQQLI